MGEMEIRLGRRRRPGAVVTTASPRGAPACRAAEMALHFHPDGAVRACCVNSIPLGHIGIDRLPDVWSGVARRDLVARLARHDMSAGCGGCASELAVEGRSGSYPELFDERAQGGGTDWPTWMEFNLSNSCNLQCLQCDGDLSSSIRAHRERRPPMPKVYDDQFFEDLRPFLPHLRTAQFAGGEPFLGTENFRVWDIMEEVGATATCIVVTNATQWNDRVERALRQVRMGFTISLDGLGRETYESIRVGADHAAVMTNIGRLARHARSEGTPLSVNHCLMVQNHHEFGDFLLWAESEGMAVNVSVVRGPARCTISQLPHDELRAVAAGLQDDDVRVSAGLDLNLATWKRELRRITQWAEADPDEMGDLWASSRHAAVLGFDGQGAGPYDEREAVADLSRHTTGPVHWVSVGSDDIIQETSEGLAEALRLPADHLRYAHVAAMQAAVQHRFGALQGNDVIASGPDRVDSLARFADVEVHVSMVARRDARGRLTEGRLLLALPDGP